MILVGNAFSSFVSIQFSSFLERSISQLFMLGKPSKKIGIFQDLVLNNWAGIGSLKLFAFFGNHFLY